MKSEELKKLKEIVEQLQTKKNEILKIQKEIITLENTKEVKRYLNLLDLLVEKNGERNIDIDKFSDKKIINIALNKVKLTPDEEIYVYLGTYKYNDEVDIIHGSNDISVSRTNQDADYVMYQNLESKYDGPIQVPYKKADEFEATHKIIFPQNVASRQRYFYELQSEYFETMIFESPEEAMKKVNRLIKK